MGINDRMVFQTPGKDQMFVEKQPVDQSCPQCDSDDVARYPIGWVRGPRMVVKCQSCYFSISVERPKEEDNWPPFRSATYDWEPSPAERRNKT